jgi:outer membrane protein OmpA-like peptidoglycan-associated protein
VTAKQREFPMEQADRLIDPEANDHAVTELDGLAELRRLVVGPERAQIVKLQERLETIVRAEDVGRVLPEAIIARARQNSDLSSALSSTIGEAIKTSVRRDPQPLIDAVFPVIGPAIRKSISDALMRMMQSLNQTIEYSLSAKSWRWRLEARRTGKSFGEIVLLHTLVYRVEQIFLIHRKTGLLLLHLKADSVAAQDGDMVSGMLTAIQDFVRDSFGSNENEGLDDLRVGERNVWIVRGPEAVVAAVIWGIPQLDFKAKLQEACECIHGERGTALEAFKGDISPFEICRPRLEDCLVQARHEPVDKSKDPGKAKRRRVILAVACAVVVVLLSIWFFFRMRERAAFDGYVKALKAQPGIVVISTGREGGKYTISGLRDPLANDPDKILSGHPRLVKARLAAHWEPYQSLSPQFVLSRARRSLSPPPSATLSFSNGVLYGRGTAPAGWIAEAQRLAPTLPGISSFDRAGLTASDESAALLQKAREVLAPPDTVRLTFTNGLLVAKGSAPAGWVQNARQLAILIPGVSRWQDDVSETQPPPVTRTADQALADLASRKDVLEKKRVVRFNDFFSIDPTPEQESSLDAVAGDIKSMIGSAETAQVLLRVDVIGHTDSLGIDETRLRVSQQRAERVLALLVLRGVARDVLLPVGVADREPIVDVGADDALNRGVTFRVEVVAGRP